MNFKKLAYKTLASAIAVAPTAVVLATPASAGAVGLTVNNNGEYTSTSAQDFTFTFTLNEQYVSGDNIRFSVYNPQSGKTLGARLAQCTTATTAIDGGTVSFAAALDSTTTPASETATFTFSTSSGATPASTTACVKFPASAPQGSYSVTLFGAANKDDNDVVLVHVNNDNDVLVTAEVALELSQNIRNANDSADTNVCYIGRVTTATQPNYDGDGNDSGECVYGVAVGTNASGGFTTRITSSGQMTNSSGDTIANIANGGTFAAGTEAFGIARVVPAQTGWGGSAYNSTIALGNAAGYQFGTNGGNTATPVPTSQTTLVSHTDRIQYVEGTNATDLTLVINGIAIAGTTPAGVYTQTQSIYTTATF